MRCVVNDSLICTNRNAPVINKISETVFKIKYPCHKTYPYWKQLKHCAPSLQEAEKLIETECDKNRAGFCRSCMVYAIMMTKDQLIY
jgi:hypothetical protein